MRTRVIEFVLTVALLASNSAGAQQYRELDNGNVVRCGGYAPDGRYVFCDSGDGADKSLKERALQMYNDAKNKIDALKKSGGDLGGIEFEDRSYNH